MNKATPLLLKIFVFCALLTAISTSAIAMSFTLAWDPSDDPNIAGYYIYYKADTPDGKFDGVGAAEGPSPIDVGRSLTATINDLDDRVHFFAVSAYDNFGNESAFSNVMASHWDPARFPADSVALPANRVEFSWDAPFSATKIAYYKLVYSTDPEAIDTPVTSQVMQGTALFAGMGLLGLFGFGLNSRRLRKFLPFLAIGAILLMSGCGGSGSDSDSSWSPVESGYSENVTVVSDITTTSHTIYDLQPNTTYYWQVVAVDEDGYEQESPINSFTTETF